MSQDTHGGRRIDSSHLPSLDHIWVATCAYALTHMCVYIHEEYMDIHPSKHVAPAYSGRGLGSENKDVLARAPSRQPQRPPSARAQRPPPCKILTSQDAHSEQIPGRK